MANETDLHRMRRRPAWCPLASCLSPVPGRLSDPSRNVQPDLPLCHVVTDCLFLLPAYANISDYFEVPLDHLIVAEQNSSWSASADTQDLVAFTSKNSSLTPL